MADARGFGLLGGQRRALRDRPRLRWALLIFILMSIPVFQYGAHFSESNTDAYKIINVGAKNQDLAFTLHYFGWLDVRIPSHLEPSPTREAAEKMLEEHGASFDVDQSYSQLATYSLLPHIWLGGDPRNPSYKTASVIGFSVTLCFLYIGFWRCRYEYLGFFIVLFLMSDPMQLYEVHVRDNVNGWVVTSMLLVMAVNLPLILRPWKISAEQEIGDILRLFSLPVLSGVILGAAQHIRSETIGPAVVVFALYACSRFMTIKRKALLIGCFLIAVTVTSKSFDVYFVSVRGETIEQVEKLGGKIVGSVGYEMHHPFWHSIWAGLGDFDDKYGYIWSDEAPYSYAQPILDKLRPFDANEQLHWQEDYKRIMRDKVLSDISTDPVWFIRIIMKRAQHIMSNNTPVRVGYGDWAINVVPNGLISTLLMLLICVPVIIAFRLHSYTYIALFLCSSGLVSVAVTTSSNGQYYVMLHVFMAAVICSWLLEFAIRAKDWIYESGGMRPQTSSSP